MKKAEKEYLLAEICEDGAGYRDVLSIATAADIVRYFERLRGNTIAVPSNAPGYEKLDDVLTRAFNQAANGKGKERHADGRPFHEQPMQTIAQQVGVGFITGQAMKKLGESTKLPRDRAIHELLGAIVYAAGAVIFLESVQSEVPIDDKPTR